MLKKFLIGTFVALALMVTSTAFAAYDFGPSTLKVGSKGVYVSTLQTFVGATADGAFGPMTKAKVVAWQASNGLTADGLFGAMSKAKANSTASVFPAGCTNASGFSTISGASCASVTANTFSPAGCTNASGFSPVTGGACVAVNATTLPAGCVTGAAFSATTGASCTTGVVTTTTGPLVGGAGDITVDGTSTDVEDTVTEGAASTKVLGFKVTADGSDVSLTNLKVSLENIDATATPSSYRLDRYASEVSVYMGSTKVGSALVADFTKDGITYSKSIALNNAIVREGVSKKATFYITVTANPSIDSVNMATDKWAVMVDNFRFQDATGVIMTSSQSEGSISSIIPISTSTFNFSSLATSGDVKVVVSKGTSSPLAQNIEVSDSASTKDVLALEFKIKATGTEVSFDTLTVDATVVGVNAVGELQLRNGSDVLATIDGSNLDASSVFNLDNTFTIAKDATSTFRVYATINDADNFTSPVVITGGVTSGGVTSGSLQVDFVSFTPEDSNGDTITSTGTVTGAVQTFVVAGASVTYVSDSYTPATIDGTVTTEGTIAMTFKVTAFGTNDVIINTDQLSGVLNTARAAGATSVAGSGFIDYTIVGAVGSASIVTSSTATAVGTVFTISAGSTETFTLSAKVGISSGFVVLNLNKVDGTPVSNVKTSAH